LVQLYNKGVKQPTLSKQFGLSQQRVSEIVRKQSKKFKQREALMAYAFAKLEQGDTHAVRDCMVDIEVLDAS
jgi:predicted XRE-type DNA-binding protein